MVPNHRQPRWSCALQPFYSSVDRLCLRRTKTETTRRRPKRTACLRWCIWDVRWSYTCEGGQSSPICQDREMAEMKTYWLRLILTNNLNYSLRPFDFNSISIQKISLRPFDFNSISIIQKISLRPFDFNSISLIQKISLRPFGFNSTLD